MKESINVFDIYSDNIYYIMHLNVVRDLVKTLTNQSPEEKNKTKQ